MVEVVAPNIATIASAVEGFDTTVKNIKGDIVASNNAVKTSLDELTKKVNAPQTITVDIPDKNIHCTAEVGKSTLQSINSLCDSVKGLKPKRIDLHLEIQGKTFLVFFVTLVLALFIRCLIYINSPQYLSNEYYSLYANMDYGNPGGAYHDAYLLVSSGHRKVLKSMIKCDRDKFASFHEMAMVLKPLLDSSVVVRNIQYGPQGDRLVQYRFRGNDVMWHAYFSSDGSVLVTDSELITTVVDAEKTLTSKKVKWQQVK